MQIDFERLAERECLDEVPLVVDVETVLDCVVFDVGDEPSDIYSHTPMLPGSTDNSFATNLHT
jgi:hypothetical protein